MLMVSFVICLHASYAYQRKPCFLDGTGSPRNPGIALRITRNAFDYLQRIMSPMMNAEIARFRMPFVSSGSSFGSTYEVEDLRVERYTPPNEVSLKLVSNSPTQLRLYGRGLSAELSAYLSSNSFLLSSTSIYFDLDDVEFTIGFAVRLGRSNKAAVVVTECDFNYGHIDVSRERFSSSPLLNVIVNAIVDRKLKSFFDNKVCDILQTDGAAKLTEWIGRVPGEIKLFDPQKSSNRGKRASTRFLSLNNLMGQLLAMVTRLSVELRIVRDAQVLNAGTSPYLEIPLSGEVRIRGTPSVPFHPKPMPSVRKNLYHHFYVAVSEFTLNSLLYQLYANDLMNAVVDGSTSSPDVSDFLQTSCPGDHCVGSLLPAAFRGQKRQFLEMRIFPTTCPTVKIQGQKGILVELTLTVQFLTKAPARKVLYTLKMRGGGRLVIQSKLNNRVTGKFTASDLQFQTKGQGNKDVFDFVSDIASSAMEAKINEIMETGFRIPSLGIGQLKNLQIQTDNGALWIGVNVVLNSAMIKNSIANLVQKQMGAYDDY